MRRFGRRVARRELGEQELKGEVDTGKPGLAAGLQQPGTDGLPDSSRRRYRLGHVRRWLSTRVRTGVPAVDAKNQRLSWWSDSSAILFPMVALALLPSVYSNYALLINLAVFIVLAQGINVVYGFAGYLPFGYVGVFGVGAYAGSLAILDLHLPPEVALLFGGVAGTVIGTVLLPLFRLSGAYFAIATLAASLVLENVVNNPSLIGITNGPYGLSLATAYDQTASYASAVILVGVATAAVVAVKRSRFGLALRALRSDPESALMAGINVPMERSSAWLIAAALAGIAGATFAWSISVFYPSSVFNISKSVFAIVFAFFGGMGTAWGPIVGTGILYGLYSVVGLSAPSVFELMYGAVIMAVVLFFPGGCASLVRFFKDSATRKATRRHSKEVMQGTCNAIPVDSGSLGSAEQVASLEVIDDKAAKGPVGK